MFQRLTFPFLVAATALAWSLPAAADIHQCRVARDKGESATAEYYNPRVAQIDEMATKGVKLDDVKLKVPMAEGSEKWMTLTEVKGTLLDQKQKALEAVASAIADCESGLRPYQNVMDTFVTIATGGLSKLLPERVTHIDVSDILAGYPLGGDGAFIPHLREQLLARNRGTVANVIRDPWKCITFQRKC